MDNFINVKVTKDEDSGLAKIWIDSEDITAFLDNEGYIVVKANYLKDIEKRLSEADEY